MSDAQYWKEFGDRLREIRGKRSTEQMADTLDIDQSGYSKFETAKRRMTLPLVCRFCELFQVDIEWLTTGKRRVRAKQKRVPRKAS